MNLLRELAVVAAGGALGASARHVLTQLAQRWLGAGFPWGTLLVNVAGSLALGFAYVLLTERLGGLLRPAVVVGFVGALTTFSTFSMDTLALIQHGQLTLAGINIMANVLACLAAVWLGLVVCRHLLIVS